ncbi:MAG: hypothetical protein AAF224_13890 [Pseudomonadota bacterium]
MSFPNTHKSSDLTGESSDLTGAVDDYLQSNEQRIGKSLIAKFRAENGRSKDIPFKSGVNDCVELIGQMDAKRIASKLDYGADYDRALEEQREYTQKMVSALQAGKDQSSVLSEGEGLLGPVWPPSNITWFSSVAISESKERALVYRHKYCGPLCASGNVFELTNTGSGWSIQKSANVYIS